MQTSDRWPPSARPYLNPKIEKLFARMAPGRGRWRARPGDAFREVYTIMDAYIDDCLGGTCFPVSDYYRAMVDRVHRDGLCVRMPSESTFRRTVKRERSRRLAEAAARTGTVDPERLQGIMVTAVPEAVGRD